MRLRASGTNNKILTDMLVVKSCSRLTCFCGLDFIGFSVYSTSDQLPNIGDDVIFPGVTTNAGGGYSTDTSRFTCPVTGYYYFYFSLRTYLANGGYDECLILILKDGSIMTSVTYRFNIMSSVIMTLFSTTFTN